MRLICHAGREAFAVGALSALVRRCESEWSICAVNATVNPAARPIVVVTTRIRTCFPRHRLRLRGWSSIASARAALRLGDRANGTAADALGDDPVFIRNGSVARTKARYSNSCLFFCSGCDVACKNALRIRSPNFCASMSAVVTTVNSSKAPHTLEYCNYRQEISE